MNTYTSHVDLVPASGACRMSVISYVPHDFLDYLDHLHALSALLHKQATGLYQMSVDAFIYHLTNLPQVNI